MPFIQRTNGSIVGVYANRQGGFADEFLSDNDEELLAYLAPTNNPEMDKRDEVEAISREMLRSGFFKVSTLVSMEFYLDKVRQMPEAFGLTDEQIVIALTSPESPFYNEAFAKAKVYSDRLGAVD